MKIQKISCQKKKKGEGIKTEKCKELVFEILKTFALPKLNNIRINSEGIPKEEVGDFKKELERSFDKIAEDFPVIALPPKAMAQFKLDDLLLSKPLPKNWSLSKNQKIMPIGNEGD